MNIFPLFLQLCIDVINPHSLVTTITVLWTKLETLAQHQAQFLLPHSNSPTNSLTLLVLTYQKYA